MTISPDNMDVKLCVNCKTQAQHPKPGGGYYAFCGIKCGKIFLAKVGTCEKCKKSKWVENTGKVHPYCSITCAKKT